MGSNFISNQSEQISLREARQRRGLTLKEAASLVGMMDNDLDQYEQNPENVFPSIALRLARLYNVSVDDLSFI